MIRLICRSCFNTGRFGFHWLQSNPRGTCDECGARYTKVMDYNGESEPETVAEQLGFEGLE